MKADLSRLTFDPTRRYSGVLMQQGRVQLDSEWNEQQEIHQYRAQAGAGDVIGPRGTPIDQDGEATGFEITARDGGLFIGVGHIYVDGILCVNESDGPLPYERQPDLPSEVDLTGWMAGAESEDFRPGLVYLDVWERHITHLDDDRIREVALGGPDTTTRKQTVWQTKVMALDPDDDDAALLARYAELRDKPNPSKAEGEELERISPRAVEILDSLCERGGAALDALGEPPTGTLSAQAEEESGATGPCEIPPGGGYERLENQLYRVEVHRSGNRVTARFKWSRDNGSVATGIEEVDVGSKEITVKDTGRDEFLSFANGQWVEVVDDNTELKGEYRTLLQIDKPVDHARRIITVKQTPPSIDPTLHPKLRRWDQQKGATENGVQLTDTGTELEDGIEVKIASGQYRAGDYWLIPARTATGDVEWPRADPEVPDSGPAELPPQGVRHRFCALAIVATSGENRLTVLHDCRNLFPQLTDLTGFFYLGGDGQEAMPGKELPEPLRVGVANGQWPVKGKRVEFEILDSEGSLQSEDDTITGENSLVVLTDAEGVASCRWTLDKNVEKLVQRVKATLLDVEEGTLHLPIHFSANLSVASQVAYEPGDCEILRDDETTVQTAIDTLSHLSSLFYLSGDGQHVSPDDLDLDPLEVLVVNDCGPVSGAKVSFEVNQGNGTLSDETVETDDRGVAVTKWALDPDTPVQLVTATLADTSGTRGPTSFVFTATLNKTQARHVSYDPANCEFLAETTTVQEAIDQLCQRSEGPTDTGFHVVEVLKISDGHPLRNDSELPVEEFMRGLRINFDREVESKTVNPATCFVTIDLPWPITSDERGFFHVEQIVGFQPLILRSTPDPGGKTIVWVPGFEQAFTNALSIMGNFTRRIPARLTLKGNFITAKGEPDIYLDGDTFGDQRDASGIRRPSGDGRRGGDFEMYVWLTTTIVIN
ncbi:MAG TPA: DUF6519 domain-containing protein [Rubrobacter sp.]|nr:DUF6519 domain-containing protein [Rubrobacter sp.]